GEIRGQAVSQATVAVGHTQARDNGLQLAVSPNPMTARSTASFYLPRRDNVSLVLYDVAGAAVRPVLNGPQEAGWHDGAIDTPRLSSGMYFLSLRTGASQLSRKVVVVR